MRERTPVFDRRVIDLLYSVIDAADATVAGAVLHDYYADAASALKECGLLQPHGYELAAASLADHDDVAVSLTWSPDDHGYGYFSASAGWIIVPDDRISLFRVDIAAFIAWLLSEIDGSSRTTPVPLVSDLLWEIGDVRLEGRSKRVPLWIGRRLSDPEVWRQFADTVRARPAPGLRIVLSLTPACRLPEQIIRGHSIIAVRDVADHDSGLVIDPDLLAARVASGPQLTDAPITMAADGASVTVCGQRYSFPGLKQRAVIRILYEAWQDGAPECLTAEVLEMAGYSGSVNTLAKAFSRRTDWREFILEQHGRCWMFH